jgi:hypothetical protein
MVSALYRPCSGSSHRTSAYDAGVAFDRETRDSVNSYARDDLDGDLNNHVEFFSFLAGDPDLMRRVGEEYFSARYLYKLWEGIRLGEDWARRAQVQQYASIYEACLHHLLFGRCAATPEVQALLKLRTLKEWNVAGPVRAKLAEAPAPDGRAVVAAIESWITHDETRSASNTKRTLRCCSASSTKGSPRS